MSHRRSRSRRLPTAGGSPASLVGRPTSRPRPAYIILRALFQLVAVALFRVRVSGVEHLPRGRDGTPVGSWICVALPHRTWVEPMLLIARLPAQPRLAVLVDGSTATRSWWRRVAVGSAGGAVAVPRRAATSTAAFDRIASAAAAWLAAGAVFALFPEVGKPSRAPALRRVAPSPAYLALRSGRPIVPVVFGGTHDVFLGRRIVMRILPALAPPADAPVRGSTAERDAARAMMAELMARVEPAAVAAHRATAPPPGSRRRWRWLHGPYPRAD